MPDNGAMRSRLYQLDAFACTVRCAVDGERVRLEGGCVFYLEGEAEY